MSTMTVAFGNAILDFQLGRTTYGFPTTSVALCTADPGNSGGAITNEITTTGYARAASGTGGGSIWSATSAEATSNIATVTFGVAISGGSVTATFAALVDAAGNVLHKVALLSPRTFNPGDTIAAAAGAITWTIS